MEMKRNKVGVITFLTPDGAMIGEEMGPFDAEISDCLEGDELRLVIDFDHVPYIDSEGLERLLDAFHQVREKNGHIKISNPNPLCSEILEITRMTNYFDIYFDLEKAARSFL